MLRCDKCESRMACGHYGICLDGHVTQPEHETPAAPQEPVWDRDQESGDAPTSAKRKKGGKRRKR